MIDDHTAPASDDDTAAAADATEPGPGAAAARLPAPLQVRDPSRYKVLAEHGRGGIGRVVRATDREFGRDVALKELLKRSPMAEARFLREAVITSRLEHPNIVPVHEAGHWPDGTPFYTMKLVSGRSLRELIDEARTLEDRLAHLPRVLAVADAIAYAHARGVIHRDLKPANIIVGEYGETVVIDWGLAKYVADAEEPIPDEPSAERLAPHLTVAGTVLGTPAYMAPEQATGGTVDERGDVYAIGAILSDLLGSKAQLAEGSGPDGNPLPSRRELGREVPADLASIVRRAMARDPADRYPGARELGDDLRRFLAGRRVRAHRYTARQRVSRWLSARRGLMQGIAAVLVLALGATIWVLTRESRLRRVAEVAQGTAETERDRADRQTIALLQQQGRAELASGHPFRAAPFLAEAYRRNPTDLRVRWLVTDALRALDALTVSFDSKPAPQPGGMPDRYVFSVAFSPDDRELLTGHMSSVAFWDPGTGRLLRRWPREGHGHSGRFSTDGTRLLLFENGTTARAADATTGAELLALEHPETSGGEGAFVEWSNDGRKLVSLSDKGHLEVWSAAPAARQFAMPGTFGGGDDIAFSADDKLIAINQSKAAVVISAATGAVVQRLALSNEEVQGLSFSADARSLLMLTSDRAPRVWDVATGVLRGRLREHLSPPSTGLFSADGSLIATTDTDAIHFWDASSQVRVAAVDAQTRAGVWRATFAHRGQRLVTTTKDGHVQTWDLDPDRWARPLPGHVGKVSGTYLPDGRVVTFDEDAELHGTVRLWNAGTGRLEASWPIDWRQWCITPSRDGALVGFISTDGHAQVLDVRTGQVRRLSPGENDRCVIFSPDGRRIAIASGKGTVRIEDAAGGGDVFALHVPEGKEFYSAAFSPDGRQILVTGMGPSQIWDATTGDLVRELPAESRRAYGRYSPDGRRIITGSRLDYIARVWDAADGKLVTELEGHRDEIRSVAFSPDGTLIATSSADRTGRIWDAATGALLRTIEGPVLSMSFSPDGKHVLATGGRYAVIWNIEPDRRSPAEVAAVVAAKSPWHLVDGQLTLRAP